MQNMYDNLSFMRMLQKLEEVYVDFTESWFLTMVASIDTMQKSGSISDGKSFTEFYWSNTCCLVWYLDLSNYNISQGGWGINVKTLT